MTTSAKAGMPASMRNGAYELVLAPEGYPGFRYRGKYVLEHHLVWWQNTGQLVPIGCVVHHKNENTRDNHFENLELKTLAKHSSDHNQDRRRPDVTVECAWCHRPFLLSARDKAWKDSQGATRYFCCRSHAVKMQMRDQYGDQEHGTATSYYTRKCRCAACRGYAAAKQRRYRAKKSSSA